MSRWAEITSRCARWFSSYSFFEAFLLFCAIFEVYVFVGYSIYFYCASGPLNQSTRFSVCHYDYTAQTPTTKWISSMAMLNEIRSLVAQNKAWVEQQNAIAQEQNAMVVEQDAVTSDLAAWVSTVSALVTPLSNYMVSMGNEQTGEEASPLETEQQQALVEQLAAVTSRLSDVVSKHVDFEAKKKNEQTLHDKLRTETLVEERLGIERKKIETEKAKLQEERQSLEAEKEALEAKAKMLGIEEDKLLTTTPEEFTKLIDAQEKLHDDLNELHDEIEEPSDDKGAEEIAKLEKDFRAKTRETFFLMAANDKRISEAWDLLDSMDSITLEMRQQNDFNDYYVKTVAMFLAEHMLEENKTENGPEVEKQLGAKEEPQEEKGPAVLEVTEDLPEVKTHSVEEGHPVDEEPREKTVLQVQDGLQ
ncbi:hypothetical protein VF21_06809 [Pseudogymnoascus sp. 05NY08]|nr:hypothetical protein VF21_06809 [Pseudogymnoascus sp. 05NY08]